MAKVIRYASSCFNVSVFRNTFDRIFHRGGGNVSNVPSHPYTLLESQTSNVKQNTLLPSKKELMESEKLKRRLNNAGSPNGIKKGEVENSPGDPAGGTTAEPAFPMDHFGLEGPQVRTTGEQKTSCFTHFLKGPPAADGFMDINLTFKGTVNLKGKIKYE